MSYWENIHVYGRNSLPYLSWEYFSCVTWKRLWCSSIKYAYSTLSKQWSEIYDWFVHHRLIKGSLTVKKNDVWIQAWESKSNESRWQKLHKANARKFENWFFFKVPLQIICLSWFPSINIFPLCAICFYVL